MWTDENEIFQKRPRHGRVSRVKYKMSDGHITFVSLLLEIFSSIIVCLEINPALLNV